MPNKRPNVIPEPDNRAQRFSTGAILINQAPVDYFKEEALTSLNLYWNRLSFGRNRRTNFYFTR